MNDAISYDGAPRIVGAEQQPGYNKMLTVLRSKAGGWVAKIFIGLLAASFAVWGISDVFRGSRTDTLATVGEKEITVEQFQETFRNQLNRISQQLGKPITPD
ncbi:MAG TPA: hypothetical protein ENJ62_04370, partial [Bryobacterales bacterium]|nr:hypothetical protein [Bryobacterales bacterium]